MFLKIETIGKKKLLGKKNRMSLSNNKTLDLWRDFMSQRKEIVAEVSEDLYSVQLYDSLLDIKDFKPTTVFEKWAAIELLGKKYNNNNPNSEEEVWIPVKPRLINVFR